MTARWLLVAAPLALKPTLGVSLILAIGFYHLPE